MKIIITPEDIIKRCLWDSYVYYILGSEKDGKEVLEKNEEFEISEKDALVIGLLKVIETDNLIHKFNSHLSDVLANKTKKTDNKLLINKNVLDSAVDKFMSNFPDYWEVPIYLKEPIEELTEYVDYIKEKLQNLEIHIVEDRNMRFEMYSSNSIKKIMKFNY
jgi:hypothetical protein